LLAVGASVYDGLYHYTLYFQRSAEEAACLTQRLPQRSRFFVRAQAARLRWFGVPGGLKSASAAR